MKESKKRNFGGSDLLGRQSELPNPNHSLVTVIPAEIESLLAEQGFVTLSQLYDRLPRNRENGRRLIGFNTLCEYARIGLMKTRVLNRKNMRVLDRDMVEWFFRVLPTGQREFQLIHESFRDNHWYIGESDEFNKPAGRSRAENLRLHREREKLATKYCNLVNDILPDLEENRLSEDDVLESLKPLESEVRQLV